jgi:shikimate dehydrogenase/3-dehydroquinate dehydratase type I
MLEGHTRIAAILPKDRADLVHRLHALDGIADAAEVRLDGLWPRVPDEETATEDLIAAVEAAKLPLVATLRPVRQGGLFDGPENIRLGLLAAAAKAGFTLLDVEADVLANRGLIPALEGEARLIVSHHQASTPTCDEGGRLLVSMHDVEAELDKLVFAAHSFADTLRALELTRKHALRGGRPGISTLGMGGAPLRALLALAGNRCTYGYPPGAQPAAPGQPGLAEAQAIWDHWGLTKRELDGLAQQPAQYFAVLGTPIQHSLSPRIMNAALRTAGRRERFGALDVPASAAALRLVCMVASRIGLAGATVTAPHKADAVRMGEADAVAKAVGAANCLRFGEGVAATNTDATALRRLMEDHVDEGAPAVVLGAGGAARAAIWALQDLGAKVRFTSIDPARAQGVVRDLGAKWTPWDQRAELAGQAWVQATPLGKGQPSPVQASQLKGAPLVVELVYKGGDTPLQTDAAARGCAVIDGKSVLVEQAIDAYRHWFQEPPSRDAMMRALGEVA